MAFDPYLIWLDISPRERPVNYYRLFGLRPLEADVGVIAAAAQRAIGHVAQFQSSPQAAECRQLLGELNAARACLLDPARKAAYDRGFSAPGGAERVMAGPPLPGAPAAQRPAGSAAAMPAWLANAQAKRGPRQGERQVVSSPPPPTPSATPGARWATPAAPAQPVPSPALPTPAPTRQPASFDAPLKPMHPSGAIPFGSAPSAPQSYVPPTSAATSYSPPQVPASQPPAAAAAYTPLAAPAYAPPRPPPAWAEAERTGQVGTVVAGNQSAAATIIEPPRRVVRRAQNQTLVYVVVALALAMIIFFFGAVLLLALFLAS